MSSIQTSLGEIELRPASPDELAAVSDRWPFGLVRSGAAFELPFSDPVGAMAGLYLPQVPLEERAEADPVLSKGRAALARGLGRLAKHPDPIEGLLLASAVLREEGAAWVPGLAFFAVPEPEASPASGTAADLERDLEPGSGTLLDRGLDALAAARRGLPPVRGVKVVGAPYMGARHLDFLLVGRDLYCLHEEPVGEDPVWEAVAKAQVRTVIHLPLSGISGGRPIAPRVVSPLDASDLVPPLAEAARAEDSPVDAAGSDRAAPEDAALEEDEAVGERRVVLEVASPSAEGPAVQVPRGQGPIRVPHLGLTPRGARRMYRFLWHLAACDGEVHESELAILESYRERLGLELEDALVLEAEGRAGEHLTIGKRAVERALLLDALLDVAAADGRLDRAEEKRLVALGNLLEVSRSEIRTAIQERFAHQEADLLVVESAVGTISPDTPTYRGVRRIYRVLWNLAACDGHIARGEVQLLEAFRIRHVIPRDEARSLEREGRQGRGLQVSKSETERSLLANELIELAAVDGEISVAERRRIHKLGRLLRMDRPELERRIRSRVSQLGARALEATDAGQDAVVASEAGQEAGQEAEPRDSETPSLHIGNLAHTSSPERKGADLEASQAARGSGGAALVILGLPAEALVTFDLSPLQLGGGQAQGGLGLRGIRPGVHRIALTQDQDEEVVAWTRLCEGEVQVLQLEGRSLAAAAPRELTHYLPRVQAGELDSELSVVRADASWVAITAPLQEGPFPPRLHAPSDSEPHRRLEEVWLETHRGQAEGLCCELAYAFLLGVFSEGRSATTALARWSSLVQGVYHCGDELPLRDPALFSGLVDLLIAQQRLLPREQLQANTPAGSGAHYLSEDLEQTGRPLLIDAGRRWATFCGGYHPNAPEPSKRPQQLLAPQRTAASKLHAGSLAQALAVLEEEEERSGVGSASLIPLLAHIGQLQELSHDLFAAIAIQQRLLELGAANTVPSDLLAKGLERMARLQREVGRGREADRLEQEARAHRQ